MGFAVRNDGKGWRAVNGVGDLLDGEYFSQTQPAPVGTSSVPESVTMRQARLALMRSGKLNAVNSAIAEMPGEEGDTARIEWEFSGTVERNWGFVKQVAFQIGLSDNDLDDLFVLAASL